jgi:hypothetical protein
LVPRPIAGRSGIYLCSPELVRPVVVCAVDLLVKPTETISHRGLEWVWGLDRRGLTVLEQQPSLAEAVAAISATVREATAEVIAGAAELAGMPSLGALVIGEVGGAGAAIMVAPLVVPLELGVELINVVSMLLPAGDVRAWASLDFAKSWTETTVTHGLDHYLEPWSGLVSLMAGVWLSSLLVISRRSRLETRLPIDTGLDDVDPDWPYVRRGADDLGFQGPPSVTSLVTDPYPSTPSRGSTRPDADRGQRGDERGAGSRASRAYQATELQRNLEQASEYLGPGQAPAQSDQQDIAVYQTALDAPPRWRDAAIAPSRVEVVADERLPAGVDPGMPQRGYLDQSLREAL